MLVNEALLDGIIVTLVISLWVALILKINPRYEMKSYPPAIVKTVPAQTRQEKQAFVAMAVPTLLVLLAYLVYSTLTAYAGTAVSYATLFLHLFTVFMIWNLFDLVVYDWLVFCTINPDFMVLPGTKGHPAYKDYGYHFVSFFKGIVISVIAAVLIAGLVAVFR